MPNRFSKYHYQKPAFKRAALSNLRDADVSPGGAINQGEILAGECGFFVAEAHVPDYRGTVLEYLPNRCCEWQGFFLTCMALDSLPAGPVPRGLAGGLRHRHCVVAEFVSRASATSAKAAGLPLIGTTDGRQVANLEIASIPGRQPAYRRARLL
jgi:hypothetical protein